MNWFGRDLGQPHPRPWTASRPPKPYSRRVLDPPTVTLHSGMLVGFVMAVWAPGWRAVGVLVFVACCVLAMAYATRDVVRTFHERRWLNSPGPRDTLDDL